MTDGDCLSCGHARVFHQIGTGNGVPVGQEYCDDRHDDPCNCTRYVVLQPEQDRREIISEKPRKPDVLRVERGDYIRAGGNAECSTCGFEYYDHDTVRGFRWLHRACDGRLLKL